MSAIRMCAVSQGCRFGVGFSVVGCAVRFGFRFGYWIEFEYFHFDSSFFGVPLLGLFSFWFWLFPVVVAAHSAQGSQLLGVRSYELYACTACVNA